MLFMWTWYDDIWWYVHIYNIPMEYFMLYILNYVCVCSLLDGGGFIHILMSLSNIISSICVESTIYLSTQVKKYYSNSRR